MLCTVYSSEPCLYYREKQMSRAGLGYWSLEAQKKGLELLVCHVIAVCCG